MQSQQNEGVKATLYTAANNAAIIAPTGASSGGDITDLGPTSQSVMVLTIDAAGSCTLTDGTLYGYDAIDAKWRLIGLLNQGLVITLTATIGFAQRMVDIGTYSRLAVSGTLDASTVTIQVKGIEYK